MKIVLLHLRVVNDKTILSWDYTALLSSYFNHHSPTLQVNLPTGTVYLNRYTYLNRFKIYQGVDPDCFFFVFGYKKPDRATVLKLLLKHQEKKSIPILKQRAKFKKTA